MDVTTINAHSYGTVEDELFTGESQYSGEVNSCERQVFAKVGEKYVPFTCL